MRRRAGATCDRSTIKRSKNVINRPLASTTLPVPRAVFLDAWTLDTTATLTDFDLAASHGSCSTHARASSIEDRSRTRGVGVALRSRTATAPPMCVSLAARAPTPMRPTCCRAPCAACAHCSLLTAPRAWAGSPGKYGVRSKYYVGNGRWWEHGQGHLHLEDVEHAWEVHG